MEALKQYLALYLFSNLIFGLCILGALKKPMWARLFLAGFFLWACYLNSTLVVKLPEVYLDYGKFTFSSFYREFIYGYFSQHTKTIIHIIAFGQFLLFLGLLLNRTWTKLACIGGIIFGLAIAPLGVGAAFPATISMAIAFFILLKNYKHDFIWNWRQYKNETFIYRKPSK
ncbi:hypothetical protein SAMN06265350_105221 [Solitalea koreensis]|uniref:Uncharacterized protein n=2 Tax=Solitalea koreensis TaxID=543615 RepID=A0A521D2R7_9SPHI|nr:hypothetical protein SAMN06265350_105221 [Solitalea koreensis]